MEYFSTRDNKIRESFKNILFQGLSKDGGLFLPISWPSLNIQSLRNKTYEELAFIIFNKFIDKEISEEDLKEIIDKTYKNFRHPKIAPLVNVDSNKYILELFYGPTFAFKDYAMQFLGNLFSYALSKNNKKITVLGATSGDTGSAAIEAFKGKENVNVFILHPYNKVSEVQRKQMTTILNNNIFNIAVEGNFDDCQKIVKNLFLDKELQNQTSLTAINSINWARLMAQIVYYFWAYIQLEKESVNFIVPSGNFGNIFSAHIAQHMGLPISQLCIVTNENDILNRIISSGMMILRNVHQTHSPSMDIQISSNFERQIFESVNYDSDEVKKIMNEFDKNSEYIFSQSTHKHLKNIYNSTSVSNEKTLMTIKKFKQQYNYLADPHTATGLSVLESTAKDEPFISLACAHPAKFSNAIAKATGIAPDYPKELKNIFDKEEKMTILPNNLQEIKSLILKTINL